MFNKKFIHIFLLTVISFSLLYSQKPPQIIGIYNNFKSERKTKVVTGMGVIIGWSYKNNQYNYYALVQEAGDGIAPPVLLQVKVTKNEIEFTIPDTQVQRTFKGQITEKELVGKFEGQDAIIHLKRSRSHWL